MVFKSDCIDKIFEKFKSIQQKLLDFLEDDENIDENFNNLKRFFEDTKLQDCQQQIKLFLHLLLKVADQHNHRKNHVIVYYLYGIYLISIIDSYCDGLHDKKKKKVYIKQIL